MNDNIPNNLANMNNNNQELKQPQSNKIHNAVLTILVVGSLMLAVIGLSFAYFSASVTGNNTASSIIVNTANIGQITFTNDNLNLSNAFPGDSTNVKFYIKSDSNSKGNYTIPYTIYWQSINNNFSNKDDLLYSISCDNGGPSKSESQVPSSASGEPEIANGNLVVNNQQVTHTCTLIVKFSETGSNQNSNQDKKFSGTIGVKLKQPYFNNANKSGTSTVPSKE